MTTSVEENHTLPQESYKVDEDVRVSPRCSTPISVPRSLYLPAEKEQSKNNIEKSSAYCEWKKRLEHEQSSRQFKLRGTGSAIGPCVSQNCEMISGYLKIKSESEKPIINEETILRPAPIHDRVWLPVSYEPFLNPAAMNIDNNKITSNDIQHDQNSTWSEDQQPQQSSKRYFHLAPGAEMFRPINIFSGSTASSFLNISNNINYHYYQHQDYHCDRNIWRYGITQQDHFYDTESEPLQCNAHNFGLVPALDKVYCSSDTSATEQWNEGFLSPASVPSV